jgi:polysaccharide biosynthesis protein PelA
MMEIAAFDPLFTYLHDSDFLRNEQGIPVKNDSYDTFMLDLCSTRWHGLLHHRIGRLLTKGRYDGVFLDTIGNVEMLEIPEALRARQFQAAIQLVEEIREYHADCVLIQNNGLNALCLETARHLDGICWENPAFHISSALDWSNGVSRKLKSLSNTEGIRDRKSVV